MLGNQKITNKVQSMFHMKQDSNYPIIFTRQKKTGNLNLGSSIAGGQLFGHQATNYIWKLNKKVHN